MDTCSVNPNVERSAKDDSEDSSFSLYYAKPFVPCGKKRILQLDLLLFKWTEVLLAVALAQFFRGEALTSVS